MPDKVRAKEDEGVYLVTAILQIKSPEILVSSLVVQDNQLALSDFFVSLGTALLK